MDWLVPAGVFVAGLGLLGLLYCIWLANKARRAQLSDAEMRDRLARLVPLNMAALFISVIGLMMAVIGVLL